MDLIWIIAGIAFFLCSLGIAYFYDSLREEN
jgi:hypothetical protein